MKRARQAFILTLGLILLPTLSWSGITEFKETSMRCGGNLIDIGDSKSRVAYLCGQPITKDIVGRTQVPENRGGWSLSSSAGPTTLRRSTFPF